MARVGVQRVRTKARMYPMEIGLYTFGELTPHWTDGSAVSAEQRLRDIIAAARLADAAGLDVFAVGEHHRLDFAIAATPVVLAAIAQVTATIRLASAVTILSTADPVKVFEDFITHAQRQPGVWFARADALAKWALESPESIKEKIAN